MTFNEAILYMISIGYTMSYDGNLLKNGKVTKTKAIDSVGYFVFKSRVGGRNIQAYLHRLQAYLKYGEKIFDNNLEVRHLDGNRLNNSYDNIALGTHSENMLDIPKEVRMEKSRKGASAVRRLSYKEAEDIRRKHSEGSTYKQLCIEYSINKSTVSYIINYKTYSDKNFTGK